jgi:hypothetical protein
MVQLAICSVATPTIREPCVLPGACPQLSQESLVILRPSWRAWFSSCSLATSSARLGSIEFTLMLWNSKKPIFKRTTIFLCYFRICFFRSNWIIRLDDGLFASSYPNGHHMPMELCFPGMRRIPTNHPNCHLLHTWNASHFPNVHFRVVAADTKLAAFQQL